MSVPATRTLEAVLGEALSGPAGLRLVVGTLVSVVDLRYVNVSINGATIKVPMIKGSIGGTLPAGSPIYLLADERRMLAIGTVG